MNLLTVNYEFPPQGGGAGVVMASLIDALAKVPDIRQTVVAGWDFNCGEPPSMPGIDLRMVAISRKSDQHTGVRAIGQFLWRAGRTLPELVPAQDLIHFHFSVPTGILAVRALGVPFVCSLHGIDVPGFVDEQALLQRALLPINRRILNRAASVFVPSSELATIVNAACPSAKVAVIPHGVDVGRFTVKKQYSQFARRFVTIARLTHWKRVDRLIDAIVELRREWADVELDIYGDGEQRSALEQRIQSAGAADYVRLRGQVTREALSTLLCEYDVFALPSVSEAFGLVFLEAMAAGLPGVGFDRGGPADVIRPGENGLLIREDRVSDLVSALSALAGTQGLAERMGRDARKLVEQQFDWSGIARRYSASYERVVADRPGVRGRISEV
jgi:hypothetical protein